jgi:hypothetical protein
LRVRVGEKSTDRADSVDSTLTKRVHQPIGAHDHRNRKFGPRGKTRPSRLGASSNRLVQCTPHEDCKEVRVCRTQRPSRIDLTDIKAVEL